MTSKAPTPMPEGMTRENGTKAPAVPPTKQIPKPPLMRVGSAGGTGNPCPLCGSGMKPSWLFFKSKGCYQPECENYWRDK